MVSVYTLKRKEPRVKLCTRVAVTIATGDDDVSFETTTVDVSSHGASVRLETKLEVGAVVTFTAIKYTYSTRAAVRSVVPDRTAGGYLIGLEYLDGRNPIVGSPRAGEREAACEPGS